MSYHHATFVALVAALICVAAVAHADDEADPRLGPDGWRDRLVLDTAIGFSSFEQQVKSEVGAEGVDPLTQDRSGSLALSATYRLAPFVRLGFFSEFDIGRRSARTFIALDADGLPTVTEARGGRFGEIWFGPLLRLQWRMLFLEVGYALVGRRWDDARTDLADVDGDTDAPLRTSRRIAWRLGLGAEVPLRGDVSLSLRVQYRLRYYDRRDRPLAGDVVHGTQGITPSVGVTWRPRFGG